jgi:hypothetical protein
MPKSILWLALLAWPAFAQMEEARTMSRTRDYNPGGRDGYCIIKVEVDDIVEIGVRGDEARLRTLNGAPGRWVMFECNQPLPRRPDEFRFRGVDGRGNVQLVQDPRERNGMAVVRIEDRKGGREEYHYRLEWRGGNTSNWGGGRDSNWDRGGGNAGWNRSLSFSGRGDGQYRTTDGGSERIHNVVTRIERDGRVTVSFDRERGGRLNFAGRVRTLSGDRVTAEVTGGDGDRLRGDMEINLDNRDRVSEINMVGGNRRERFEVRWRN